MEHRKPDHQSLLGLLRERCQGPSLVAISPNLLLAWVKAALKSPLTITEVSKVVGVSLLTKTDLFELLDVPAPLTQNQNVNELELNL